MSLTGTVSTVILGLFLVGGAVYGRMAYQLPDGSDLLLGAQLRTTFDCSGRIYGYYADVDNNCQIFHVCYPIPDGNGQIIETAQFSFLCPNTTLFSQDTLT
ncbi:unnamed protein product [Notodromas monacha]|uniref:Chitin-binding type-2 domain-containing protein n=1 Tax=Notodromas monacha TaxID=399045 RepID=A0A7R9C0L4_9CRUS|nr:unnamed protein product [Notodromas monacha]CAG0923581.1 unnamed protein product [Notodromas monacha]